MTIICEPDPSAAEALGVTVGGPATVLADLRTTAQALVALPAETLVVLGAGVDLDEALAFTSTLRLDRPAVGVLLLREDLDVAVLTRSIRAGVREVLTADDSAGLADACLRWDRLARQQAPAVMPAPARQGRIVTVFSAKGGCGKTTLATNLAVVLHAGGTRRVCLVDLDLAFGDVAISLQLEPRRTIVDALTLGDRIDGAKATSLLTPLRPGLDCLLAPVEPGDADKVPASLVGDLLHALRDQYDFVVVDTPSQLSEHVLAALDASQQHVLITTPEVPALKNLRLTLDMLDLLAYSRDDRAVVFNRSDARVGLSAADVERVVKGPIAGHVPSSRDVPASINRGVPLALEDPDHPVSQGIRRFAELHVLGEPLSAARPRRGLALRRRSA